MKEEHTKLCTVHKKETMDVSHKFKQHFENVINDSFSFNRNEYTLNIA